MQTQDKYGNPAPAPGLPVRCRLRVQEKGVEFPAGTTMPELVAIREGTLLDHSHITGETDECGRLFLGTLAIAEGSGKQALSSCLV